MKLLPPPGPQRTRQLTLLTLLALVATFFVVRAAPWRTADTPSAASNAQGAQSGARATGTGKPAASAAPEPVKLDKLEPVPDEPGAGRNLFRFGTRVLPPPPLPPPPPPPVNVDPGPPPPPPGPPPIELRLTGIFKQRADGPVYAVLSDPKSSATLTGSEGQILDGKYKLLKVGEQSVIVCYVDGSGPRTLILAK